jgi:4,5-dihydroxyphthalate decarboxylase
MKLHTLLGDYPNTAALKAGKVRSDRVDLDFADVKVPSSAFKRLVREAAFDLGEIAIVSYLQARLYDKPYVLLPVTAMARSQHHTIVYNKARGPLTPSDLNGRRVGVRAYTVTTGTWVRAFLAEDYGIDIPRVRWITFEDPHLAEYRDPAFVERAPAGKTLVQMLLDGEIDAAIVGDTLPEGLTHLVPDPEEAGRRWARAHSGMPINHMMVIRKSIAQSRPDVVKEIVRMFRESKRAANLPATEPALDPYRFGVEANRHSLELIIGYCVEQQLIPRPFSVDELFDDTTRTLA